MIFSTSGINTQNHWMVGIQWPFAKGKVFRLGHWQSQNVSDPYQYDQAFFDETCKNIQLYANDWQSHL